MKYIDTHCHLNFSAYEEDIDQVIDRTIKNEVSVINIGTQWNTSERAVALAEQHNHLWAIIGLHPIHTTASFHDKDELGEEGKTFTSRGELFDIDQYRTLAASSEKVVGIGECGFDYYRKGKETKKIQETAFRAQIELAGERNLPLMLHVRPSSGSFDAYEDTIEILREYKKTFPQLRGQAHFFAGSPEIIDSLIELGFYISFTGVVTFTKDYDHLVSHVPLERILTETDAPYVTPAPFRGQRNEPTYVIEILKALAVKKGVSEDALAERVKENVLTLYGITV